MLLRNIFSEHATNAAIQSLATAPWARSALHLMQRCGTGELGFHERHCRSCGTTLDLPNCCRQASCPFCSGSRRAQWAADRAADLLPVAHFQVVFTVAKALRPLFSANQRAAGNALFRAVHRCLSECSADPRFLGAQTAIFATMHTWNQRLDCHPHIHAVISAGGLSSQGDWIAARWNRKKHSAFFVPGRVLAACFRKHLYEALTVAYHAGAWADAPPPTLGDQLSSARAWIRWLKRSIKEIRHIHCETTMKDPRALIRYLSAYVARVAIAPSRIAAYDGQTITLSCRGRRGENKNTQHLRLSAQEFITRFSRHISPPRFRRHRYWGLLATRYKAVYRQQVLRALGKTESPPTETRHAQSEKREQIGPPRCLRCPLCHGPLETIPQRHRRLAEMENEPASLDYFDGLPLRDEYAQRRAPA